MLTFGIVRGRTETVDDARLWPSGIIRRQRAVPHIPILPGCRLVFTVRQKIGRDPHWSFS
ncbi:MAG TPA: hypothetical protein VM165_09945 [Planctomycetaceae bacterium]|nr:hypothetical protein [Planctomycetaceae bacterium]